MSSSCNQPQSTDAKGALMLEQSIWGTRGLGIMTTRLRLQFADIFSCKIMSVKLKYLILTPPTLQLGRSLLPVTIIINIQIV